MEFNKEAFGRWVDTHAVDKQCAGCGEVTEWVQGSFPGGILDVGSGVIAMDHGYEVVPLYCEKCGFIRLYAIEPFKDASKPETNGGGAGH